MALTAQQAYAMLENQSLWQTATHCHQLLQVAGITHALVGGSAVCVDGYQRHTVDVDLLVRREGAQVVREAFERGGLRWEAENAEFRAPTGTGVKVLRAGDRAGRDSEVLLPDPADARVTTPIEDLPVLTPARLIDTKIACGQRSLRRRHKDFADAVELISHHRLNRSFARFLHKSLRPAYRQWVRACRGHS